MDCLARQSPPGTGPLDPLPALFTGGRREGEGRGGEWRKRRGGRRSQRKSNNREISFRRATISTTPIGQTRFLLVIKLTSRRRVAPRRATLLSQAVRLSASGTLNYYEETCAPPSDQVARGAEVWRGQRQRLRLPGLHNVSRDYVVVSSPKSWEALNMSSAKLC